ncbi:MAG: hypothetical protein LIP16_05300 [Clostridium sp.]|nr:hypothetical protein [Clostridium sp.]
MEIPILCDSFYLAYGIERYVTWCPSKAPHAIICGATGSGKTYFTQLLLGKMALYIENCEIAVCDFKNDDDKIERVRQTVKEESFKNTFMKMYSELPITPTHLIHIREKM